MPKRARSPVPEEVDLQFNPFVIPQRHGLILNLLRNRAVADSTSAARQPAVAPPPQSPPAATVSDSDSDQEDALPAVNKIPTSRLAQLGPYLDHAKTQSAPYNETPLIFWEQGRGVRARMSVIEEGDHDQQRGNNVYMNKLEVTVNSRSGVLQRKFTGFAAANRHDIPGGVKLKQVARNACFDLAFQVAFGCPEWQPSSPSAPHLYPSI